MIMKDIICFAARNSPPPSPLWRRRVPGSRGSTVSRLHEQYTRQAPFCQAQMRLAHLDMFLNIYTPLVPLSTPCYSLSKWQRDLALLWVMCNLEINPSKTDDYLILLQNRPNVIPTQNCSIFIIGQALKQCQCFISNINILGAHSNIEHYIHFYTFPVFRWKHITENLLSFCFYLQ